jgi:alginate O-acetyltransferase complex protein AlgI
MVFSSLIFLCVFLPLTALLYYITGNRRWRNGLLIAASLVFYAWGEPGYVILLLVCGLFNYFSGLSIEKTKDRNKKKAKLVLAVSLNILILVFFKYTGFLLENLNRLLGLTVNAPDIYLPVGISFYTFKAISYVSDIYKGKITAQKSYWKFMLYISLFHHLVAGPIIRYPDIADEIDHREETPEGVRDGVRRFIAGLAKKVILSNTAAEIAGTFLDGDLSRLSVAGAWLGILLFAFRIYFDFSGYSDMAIGLARIFGLTFDENFNYPYISRSITEFWRRWHITLSGWFRDYVYIPLGGNRVSKPRHILNLLIVWALTGFWHGASWNFIFWGLYFALILIAEKYLYGNLLEKLPAVIQHVYSLLLVIVGWVIFYFEDLGSMGAYLRGMFGLDGSPLWNSQSLYYLLGYGLIFLAAAYFSTPHFKKIIERTETSEKKPVWIGTTAVYMAVFASCVAYLVNSTYNPFLYFRF